MVYAGKKAHVIFMHEKDARGNDGPIIRIYASDKFRLNSVLQTIRCGSYWSVLYSDESYPLLVPKYNYSNDDNNGHYYFQRQSAESHFVGFMSYFISNQETI